MDVLETLLRRDGAALLTMARCWVGSGPAAVAAIADAVTTVGGRQGAAVDGPALRAAVLTSVIKRLAAVPPCDEEALADLLPSYDASGTRVAIPGEEPVALEDPAAAALVRAVLPAIPPPFRQALLLVDMEGWSCERAATALGLTVPVLRRRLHLARMAMTTLVQRRAGLERAAA